jgi:hypothetical protein
MEKKNFYGDIKFLHKNIVAEIFSLMVENGKEVIDLAGSPAPHAYIIGVPDFDWDIDYIEGEVLKVIIEDGHIEFDVNWNIDTEEYLAQNPNENDDIGDLYQSIPANDFERIVPCAGLSSVYEAVYEYLENGYEGDEDEYFDEDEDEE